MVDGDVRIAHQIEDSAPDHEGDKREDIRLGANPGVRVLVLKPHTIVDETEGSEVTRPDPIG